MSNNIEKDKAEEKLIRDWLAADPDASPDHIHLSDGTILKRKIVFSLWPDQFIGWLLHKALADEIAFERFMVVCMKLLALMLLVAMFAITVCSYI